MREEARKHRELARDRREHPTLASIRISPGARCSPLASRQAWSSVARPLPSVSTREMVSHSASRARHAWNRGSRSRQQGFFDNDMVYPDRVVVALISRCKR
jgi:hypothetical protein